MRRTSAHLLRIFVTGLLAALPLAATLAIFWWAAGLLYRWLGPASAVGRVMVAIGLGVTGLADEDFAATPPGDAAPSMAPSTAASALAKCGQRIRRTRR